MMNADLSTCVDVRFGTKEVDFLYLGSQLIWQRNAGGGTETPDGPTLASEHPLSFKTYDVTVISLEPYWGSSSLNDLTLYYSYDKSNWQLWDMTPLTVPANTTIYMIGDNNGFNTYESVRTFKFRDTNGNDTTLLELSGSLRSLCKEKCSNETPAAFQHLFEYCTINNVRLYFDNDADGYGHVVYPHEYNYTFYGANISSVYFYGSADLSDYAFANMFDFSTGLSSVYGLDIFDNFGSNCCEYMFKDCSSLSNVEWNKTINNCMGYSFSGMFENCGSLSSIGITIDYTDMYSYYRMFANTGLYRTPIISSNVYLYDGCFNEMFSGCYNLSEVYALFNDEPGDSYTYNWLDGVSSSGTFYKNASWEVYGSSGIPDGWDIQSY